MYWELHPRSVPSPTSTVYQSGFFTSADLKDPDTLKDIRNLRRWLLPHAERGRHWMSKRHASDTFWEVDHLFWRSGAAS
jgi:hypothetical protein